MAPGRGRTQHESWIKVEEARRIAAQEPGNDYYDRMLPKATSARSKPNSTLPAPAPTAFSLAEAARRLGWPQVKLLTAIRTGEVKTVGSKPPMVLVIEVTRLLARDRPAPLVTDTLTRRLSVTGKSVFRDLDE